ncbi:MAG: hypothetical protein A2Y33_02705 [Spirochaetes bacterium GWF1_51_8]|nr:MAG: hypothetical protein A2Y33_02705 [Spirochaetes bacterium GWF1_51_8]
MIRAIILIGGLFLFFNPLYSKGALDFGAGVCIYGDAMGFTVRAAYQESLNGWMSLFGSPSSGGFGDDFLLAAGLNTDIVPVEFGITSIEPEITALYRLGIIRNGAAEAPGNISIYPYLGIGVPINIFTLQGSSSSGAGFMLRAGAKAGYRIMESFEAGFGAEYRMNFAGIYIGSVGVYAFASLTL